MLDHPFDEICDDLNRIARARGLSTYWYLVDAADRAVAIDATLLESSDDSEHIYMELTAGTAETLKCAACGEYWPCTVAKNAKAYRGEIVAEHRKGTCESWTVRRYHWLNGELKSDRIVAHGLTRREMMDVALALAWGVAR